MFKAKIQVVISNKEGDMKVIDEKLNIDFKQLSKLQSFINTLKKKSRHHEEELEI